MRQALTTFLAAFAVCGGAVCASPACDPSHVARAYQFLLELEKKAPSHEDVSLRKYSLADLNHDGCMEVVEKVNPVEEKAVGLLNVEISPAAEWVNIYALKNGKYSEATREFTWYFQVRKEHYALWLRIIDNPIILSDDSRQLLKNAALKAELVNLIRDHISKIDKMAGR